MRRPLYKQSRDTKSNQRANVWHPWQGKTTMPTVNMRYQGKESRQVLRAHLRAMAYKEITAKFPGEPHANRRSMAIDRAKHDYIRATNGEAIQ